MSPQAQQSKRRMSMCRKMIGKGLQHYSPYCQICPNPLKHSEFQLPLPMAECHVRFGPGRAKGAGGSGCAGEGESLPSDTARSRRRLLGEGFYGRETHNRPQAAL